MVPVAKFPPRITSKHPRLHRVRSSPSERKQSKRAVYLMLGAATMCATLTACWGGEESSNAGKPPGDTTVPHPPATNDRDAINAFLSGLGDLPAAAPDLMQGETSSSTETVADPTAPSGQTRYECTTTGYTLTANPDKIVTLNPDAGKLWLGGLLQGSGYSGGLGSLKALPIGHRSTQTVFLDLLTPDVVRAVDNPDAANVQSTIGDLVTEAENQGVSVPTVAVFQQSSASTVEQGLLSLGFSAKYLTAKASGSLSVTRNVTTSTVIASLVQRYYTAAIVTPSTPADFFGPEVTLDDFREQQELGRVGIGNPPVIVSSISYGRIFLMSISSNTTEDKLSGAVSAEFSVVGNGGKVELSVEQKKIMSEAKIQVVSNGGEEADFLDAVRTQSVDAFLARPARITAARPISFQVDNLADGSAAAFSETSNYALTTCHPQPNKMATVGHIYKLTNLAAYTTKCNQNVYGTLFINGHSILELSDADPYVKIREHTWWSPNSSQARWPLFSPPNPSRYNLSTSDFENNGYYLTVFDEPGYEGPTSGEFQISGSLNNAIFPFRDDSSNSYNAGLASPFALGSQSLPGTSVHCPLNLSYEIQLVRNLIIPVP
jgi:Thiol-activated cytolysin